MVEKRCGKVYLVGAGPGDPGLLTLRGRDCLARAEVVVYDKLAHPALLRLAPQAEHIFAGKRAGRHSLPQPDIDRLLVELARRPAVVVRLKGGDPFIFGRGGEEALALAASGIPFEVVPGVSAGVAAPAYAGIPVTHRGLSTSVTFLTGHAFDSATGGESLRRIALDGTLAVFMGAAHVGEIAESLISLGRTADTPAAVIEWGTWARQRTVRGTLGGICGACAAAGVQPPALFVVGAVAGLGEHLDWFSRRPLGGLRVVLTHAAEREGPLEALLGERGADILNFPTLRAEREPLSPEVEPGGHDWLLLTSVNAVQCVFDLLEERGLDARALAGCTIASVGATTADALRGRFLRPDVECAGYEPDAVAEILDRHRPLLGASVLLPRADVARTALAPALAARGASVTELAAYHSRPERPPRERVEALLAFKPELVVFTNAKAVRNFGEILTAGEMGQLESSAAFAAIGPVTARALRDAGLEVALEPERHTLEGLVEAVEAWWTRK